MIDAHPHAWDTRSVLGRPEYTQDLKATARAGLTFDACLRPDQPRRLIATLDAVPELRVVLDHGGNPPVRDEAGNTVALGHPRPRPGANQVTAKLSGAAVGPAPTSPTAVEVLVEAFGPARCMLGSDWPVTGEVDAPSSYAAAARMSVQDLGLSAAERRDITDCAARRFYGPAARPGGLPDVR
jgi:L-fuconolactonase